MRYLFSFFELVVVVVALLCMRARIIFNKAMIGWIFPCLYFFFFSHALSLNIRCMYANLFFFFFWNPFREIIHLQRFVLMLFSDLGD